MPARLQFQRRAFIGALAVALLGALLVAFSPASPASAATTAQYASSWIVDNDANWTPYPSHASGANPLGSGTGNCTGGNAGAWAEFTFTGFSIPATDTIDGIVVTPKYRTAANNGTLSLRDGGVVLGSKTLPINTGGPSNCNSTSTVAVGGATDTWGASLTPAIINDGIQVRLSQGTPNPIDLDSIQLTVHHSAGDPEADLSITKGDDVDPATPGEDVVYTITATNDGPSDDPGATIADTFPAGLTCTYTSVAAGGATGNTASGSGNINDLVAMPDGASITYTATCAIDSDRTTGLSNTATVTASVTDPNSGNNSAIETTAVAPEADLSITKTDDSDTVVPGGTVVYTIVAANAGPSDDPAATVADTFPASLTNCSWTAVLADGASGTTSGDSDIDEAVSLPVGASITYTATCDVDDAADAAVVNSATITASVTDPDPSNNASDDSSDPAPEADLGVSVTESADPVTAGDAAGLTYTVTVTNGGPSTAPGTTVEIDLTLPTGVTEGTAVASLGTYAGSTWTVGALAPDATATLEVPLTVDDTTAAGTDVIEIAATVSSDADDADGTNDEASEATSVEAAPTTPTTSPATTPTTPTTAAGAVGSGGQGQSPATGALPKTGAEPAAMVLFGLASILVGCAALWLTDRRSRPTGAHLR
ncbi:LPXTG cell wall anchor domain-containing protein [Actinospongicola halichondriae]|uniref:LPXTG cell wall anchor domain-containing protein n=1 Tax=Actinospongicola halichondriae TaxID=3236844 RepID=UPI003D3C5753